MDHARQGDELADVEGLATFGALLRNYRLDAGLTQEVLAERAGVGVRTIQGLEEGEHRPRGETAGRLAQALKLAGEAAARFAAAAQPNARAPRRPSPVLRLVQAGDRASPSAPNTNLPVQLTSFVGREREVAAVSGLLTARRLVTLTGAGGVGKTRLALQAAASLHGAFSGGTHFVPLAPLADASLVPSAVARALGVRAVTGRRLVECIAEFLRDGHTLVVLDTCEHVVEGCAALVDVVLRACPHVCILATSRRPLHLAGEQVFPVPSLALPDLNALPPVDTLRAIEAVQLFTDRARAVQPDFDLVAHNAATVAAICVRLDGLPLAIELASTLVALLPPTALLHHLERRLPLLSGGARNAPARQHTLRATIDWSHALLSTAEQRLFRRLALFAGGCTLEAAGAVSGSPVGRTAGTGSDTKGAYSSDGPQALDGLRALADHCLVLVAEDTSGQPRFRMLDTIREYAQERLEASGEVAAVARRFVAFYTDLAESAAPVLAGRAQVSASENRHRQDQSFWLDRLEQEHDNLHQAVLCALRWGPPAAALRLAAAVWRFWNYHTHLREGLNLLERVLAADASVGGSTPDGGDSAVPTTGRRAPAQDQERRWRADALLGAGHLAYQMGDHTLGRARLEQSLALWRGLGDESAVADVLAELGAVLVQQGDYTGARVRLQESCAVARRVGDPVQLARSLGNLAQFSRSHDDLVAAFAYGADAVAAARVAGDARGLAWALMLHADTARHRGDAQVARDLGVEGLALARQLGDTHILAGLHHIMGSMAARDGDYASARSLLEQSLEERRAIGQRAGVANSLYGLARLAHAEGDYTLARTYLAESLTLRQALGEPEAIIAALEAFGDLWWACGQPALAARLLGAAAAAREAVRVPQLLIYQADFDRAVRGLRTAMGPRAFAAAFAAGRTLALDQAVALALDESESGSCERALQTR